jgi:hypothetical protein
VGAGAEAHGTKCPASLNTYHKVVFVSGVFFDLVAQMTSLFIKSHYSGWGSSLLSVFCSKSSKRDSIPSTEVTIRTGEVKGVSAQGVQPSDESEL